MGASAPHSKSSQLASWSSLLRDSDPWQTVDSCVRVLHHPVIITHTINLYLNLSFMHRSPKFFYPDGVTKIKEFSSFTGSPMALCSNVTCYWSSKQFIKLKIIDYSDEMPDSLMDLYYCFRETCQLQHWATQ